ncbi:hypothetical protein FACS189419_03240 [Planctomycetales bacterium]|nr:hypothetical protein FACS189419_03240 [Planctomycetales bacterium]
MNFFIRVKGKPFGPFDENQITEMKSKGKIFKNTELSNDRVNWFPAETQSWLFPPAPQQEQVSPSTGGTGGASTAAELAVWFYSLDGQSGYGPVAEASIRQMLQNGQLQASSYVWREGENARLIKDEPTFSGGQVAPATVSSYPSNTNQGGVRYCTTCGAQMQPTARMCMQCGTEAYRGARQFCAVCGSPTVPTAQMCMKCGSPLGGGFTNFNAPYQGTPPSSMGIGYFDVWKKYVTFHGRARRKEYWMFLLFNALIEILLYIFGIAFVAAGQRANSEGIAIFGGFFILVYFVFSLAVFLPHLAVLFRRLHDAGYSGWFWLFNFIPFVGWIIVLVFCVQDSQPGDNQYGPNPKYG